MKKFSLAVLTVVLVLFGIESANAHAQVTLSFPAKNQNVKVQPTWVWLEFDGDLLSLADNQINRVTVTNAKKIRVDIGGSVIGGARISTKLKPGLAAGKYLVTYRVVSEDGHPIEGSYSFNYRPK